MSIQEQQIIAIQDKQAVAKAMGKSNKQERALFYGEKGESWEEKARVQGANGFSSAELLGYLISCRRRNVHLFLLGL